MLKNCHRGWSEFKSPALVANVIKTSDGGDRVVVYVQEMDFNTSIVEYNDLETRNP